MFSKNLFPGVGGDTSVPATQKENSGREELFERGGSRGRTGGRGGRGGFGIVK